MLWSTRMGVGGDKTKCVDSYTILANLATTIVGGVQKFTLIPASSENR